MFFSSPTVGNHIKNCRERETKNCKKKKKDIKGQTDYASGQYVNLKKVNLNVR